MKKLFRSLLRRKRKNESFFKYAMGILHLWLGLLSGIVVMLVCFTGCIYAFKNQFFDLYNRDKVFVHAETGTPKISLDQINNRLKTEEKVLRSVIIPESRKRSYIVAYSNVNNKQQVRTIYIHPYNGKELGTASHSFNTFFETVLELHRNLLLGDAGRQIVGAAVLMFVFLLFSGLVLWWPKKWKQLKQALTVKWKARFYRVNYDLHNTLGFYSTIFLLFIALTGLYVTYPWVKNSLIVSLGGQSIGNANGAASKADETAFNDILKDMLDRQNEIHTLKDVRPVSLDQIINLTQEKLPHEGTLSLQLPDDKNPRYVVQKNNSQNWLGALLPDEISFDKEGNFKTLHLFTQKPLNKQFTELAKPLHTGEIFGLKGIIFYFIVCLIGCSLPLTGFIIWYKKAV
ncbi:PepSY-associated TM helix domain-containing protein [Pedobacter montanisoli]|uniref:PepSY domain-containing protein n=1 Tax=Pedobacter montanisoli TaxID=2923277 RepID=A0ABS9ZUC3_9SPHI|nr:PepSY-associated TM helix domain-containing protein [Pedobacter montanisoli]MCJ0742190.1 PepSY domain-containing protein [Pedobacter montanisoli]